MITGVVPYLYFKGDCEEALNFYKKAIDAEIGQLMRISDSPKEYQTPETMHHVMHGQFSVNGSPILVSDIPASEWKEGTNISLSLNFETGEAIFKAWQAMSEGARISMELQDTFWNAKFGTLTDKYGINWMFNYDKK